MRKVLLVGIFLTGFLLSFLSASADSHLLFQLPLGDDLNAVVHGGYGEPLYAERVEKTEGPHGGVASSLKLDSRLVYEGVGNAYIPAGTISFWWRPDAKVQKSETSVADISSMQRFYFCRWLRIYTRSGRLHVTLYHGDGEETFEDAETVRVRDERQRRRNIRYELVAGKVPLEPGQWYHVAVTWDMSRGVALYVNGELVQKIAEPWYYGGNVNHISLGASSSSYTQARRAIFPQSYANLRVYDYGLSAEAIRELAENKEPVVGEPDLKPLMQERIHRLGLSSEGALPDAGNLRSRDQGLGIRQVHIVGSRDVMRNSWAGVNGDMGNAWPMYQGYSNSGETLEIELKEGSSFNAVQMLGSGPMRVELIDEAGKVEDLLNLDSTQTKLVAGLFNPKKIGRHLKVVRDHGLLFNTEILDAGLRAMPSSKDTGWTFLRLSKADDRDNAYARVREEFATYDRTILQAAESGQLTGTLVIPAGHALQILGPVVQDKQGLAEVALDLRTTGNKAPTGFSLMLLDPVNDVRRAMMANFKVTPNEYTSGVRVVLEPQKLIYRSGERPWLILYASETLTIDLPQSQIGFRWIDPAVAHEEFFQTRLAEVREAFQERSEGRPWSHSPHRLKLLRTLLNDIDVLVEMEPDNAMAKGYWHWTHPREKTPQVNLPEVPEGVPAWAFYAERANQLFKDKVYWWIDNRQTPTGEFGAPDGINDDTDLIQDWLAVDLMNGPDEKIRLAVEKVAQISWDLKTVDGVSKQTTDTLHVYEWGINAQTLAFLLNYGDPVYYERLLRFTSYYNNWMEETNQGHLHFKTWYLGIGGIRTEGVYGQDRLINSLYLQPGMLLGWYNGDPYNRDVVIRWVDAMREHIEEQSQKTNRIPGVSVAMPADKTIPENTITGSFVNAVWAAWKFSGEERFLKFAGDIINWNLTRRPLENLHSGGTIIGAYLNETQDSRWDNRWVDSAKNPVLWESSLHNNNYSALNHFYAAWQRTGDDTWLDEGSKLTLYHMTWSFPMLTVAEATTDRVWLPQRLTNRISLGDLSILRNEIFPKHAVSWEHASGRFSPLVRKHSSEELEVEIYNLESTPLTLDARLWSIVPGQYQVVKSSGESSEEYLQRYSLIPLQIPANGMLKLHLRLLEKGADLESLPDLGISHLDAKYNQETQQLTVVIHNIGLVPTGKFRAVAKVNGQQVSASELGSLLPPENFRTNKAHLVIPGVQLSDEVTVELELLSGGNEITKHNNRLKMRPEQLFKPHFTIGASERD